MRMAVFFVVLAAGFFSFLAATFVSGLGIFLAGSDSLDRPEAPLV